MITSNTKANINANKVLVDKYNTQMTTQKKINKPSEDPVIAIRSLRMQTSLSHIDQYLDNNISDADAWLEVTDTALNNMKSILTDIRTQCVNGSNDTLKEDDRNTILKQLQQLADQVYTEGNADYAGRTVFTGYRTNSQLTFTEDEQKTTYTIDQTFSYKDFSEKRYYYGSAEVPVDADDEVTNDIDTIGTNTYNRLRLAYDGIDAGTLTGVTFTYKLAADQVATVSGTAKIYADKDELNAAIEGNQVTLPYYVRETGEMTESLSVTKSYATEEEWYQASTDTPKTKSVDDSSIIFIESTGELVFGDTIANSLKKDEASISLTYAKTGFEEGEARPEYYYDCTMKTEDMTSPVTYKKENQQINYVISNGITLAANTQASDVFDTSIGRDVDEMIDIVQTAIDAHDKVDQIKQMMELDRYADDASQATLQGYLDAAEKEAAYADDNMKKTYEQYITNFDNYLEKVNLAHTNVGSLQNRLSLTKTRVENQKSTVEELKSSNDNRDISDVIIDYYAAYNAYTSSLTAAAKVGQQTLLNYL
jgi:flagellar hook-associated protein 3 FlgL